MLQIEVTFRNITKFVFSAHIKYVRVNIKIKYFVLRSGFSFIGMYKRKVKISELITLEVEN